MDFNRIIKQSIEMAWRHKTLWFFGLFAGGSGGSSLDLLTESNWSEQTSFGFPVLPEMTLLLIASALIFMVVIFSLHLISRAALIDAVNKLARGGNYRFRDSFSVGLDFFWRMFGLGLLTLGVGVVAIGILALPIIAAFAANVLAGILSLLFLIPIGLLLTFVMVNWFELACRAMVVRDTSIGEAINEAYLLFKKNRTDNLLIFAIYIGLTILVSIVSMMIIGVIVVPVGIAAYAAGGLVAAIVVALPVVLLISVVIGGFVGTGMSSLYTLFYFRLFDQPAAVPPAASETV